MTIAADVRKYIEQSTGYYFTKRDVAEALWPEWKKAGLRATNDWRCFKSYIGNLVLLEKEAGTIVEEEGEFTATGAKYYKRAALQAKAAAKVSGDLTGVPTSELVAELNRRFG